MIRRTTVAASAAVIALFGIVLVAASVQGRPRIDPPTFSPGEPPAQPLPESAPATEAPLPASPPNESLQQVLGMVLLAVAIIAAALVLYAIIRVLLQAWRDRPLRKREAAAPETAQAGVAEPEDDVAAPVVRRGIAGALHAIDAGESPSDAIIAAWVGLEETAADAGLRRGVSETPAEFALRLVSLQAQASPPAARLLSLYERVRFGGLSAGAHERGLARTALQEIEEVWR